MSIPQGKTLFLWQVNQVLKGNPAAIAERAADMGLSAVFVKAADGIDPYNQRQLALVWKDDVIGPLIEALAKVGIATWGWQYIYGFYPAQEAQRAIERMKKHPFAGWVVDAEAEMKGAEGAANVYMNTLREALPGATIGLTSYRYPTLHPELPWRALLRKVDFHMPQVYWAAAHNPAQQLTRSIAELRALEKQLGLNVLPIVPAGAAYREHGWQPLASEMVDFVAAVREKDLPGYCMWEWGCAIRAGLEDTLMELDDMKPAPVVTLSVEERLEKLEKGARLAGWRI